MDALGRLQLDSSLKIRPLRKKSGFHRKLSLTTTIQQISFYVCNHEIPDQLSSKISYQRVGHIITRFLENTIINFILLQYKSQRDKNMLLSYTTTY